MKLGQIQDLKDKRFGRLTVLEDHYRKENGKYYWKCVCDCGNTKYVSANNLKSGNTKSCGCLGAENKPPVHIAHGMSRSKLYHIWVAMKQRCENPNDRNFLRYGGRGICVCKEWGAFGPFMKWALSNGYVEGKTDIDRKDNDKGYSPENCRFISHKENLMNTHRKLHDVIRGEDITLSEAADKYGIHYRLIYQRYKRGKRGNDLVAVPKIRNFNPPHFEKEQPADHDEPSDGQAVHHAEPEI